MKAQDLRLNELVDFSRGLLSLHGRRLVLHDLHSFAQFRKDLTGMVGLDQTRRIMTRFGYFWGHADAAAMRRIFQWDDILELLRAGPQLHSLQGIVNSVVKSLAFDEASGNFEMHVVWHDSGEAQEHMLGFGKGDQPVCWTLVGYASGYASFCLGKQIYFIEQKCVAKGDLVCMAIGKNLESWGDELSADLPYFQAEDIQGKIMELTADLKRKDKELARQREQLGLARHTSVSGLVEVRSTAFLRVMDLASRVAPFDTSVLITGESGVGKEVLARHIHRTSHRSKGLFLPVNCGALPETLLESELFGHKMGAFTGAVSDRVGLFEQAAGGTLFLDEIGDVSPAVQMKLLRVLQEREVYRVGESTPRKVDVRIIAATNRNLTQAITEGQFREDLYYRLGVIVIEVPPLRQRPEDILPLARHFVDRFRRKLNRPELRLSASCLDSLQAYGWPGNVRELENTIERAAVLTYDGTISEEYFPPAMRGHSAGQARAGGLRRSLAEVEAEHIQAVLKLTDDNRTQAADILGISPTTLWRKLRTN
jgi:two-component system response regulator HydG